MKKIRKIPLCLAALSLIALPAVSQAAVLFDMTLAEWTNNSASGGSSHLTTDFVGTSTLDAGLTGILGEYVNAAGGAPMNLGGSGSNSGELNWASWTTSDGGTEQNYFSILVDVEAGYTIDLADLTVSVARNGAGAPRDLFVWVIDGDYSAGGGSLSSGTAAASINLTDAGNDVQNGEITVANPKLFDLSSVADKTGDFSLVFGARPFGGETANAEGNLRINDFVFNGIATVPEPSSAALLAGLLGLGYVMTRRRK